MSGRKLIIGAAHLDGCCSRRLRTGTWEVSAQQPYDIREVVNQVCDAGTFTEVQKDYAENIVCGFARLAGKSIGVVANQPAFLAGVLDNNASTKAARFVRTPLPLTRIGALLPVIAKRVEDQGCRHVGHVVRRFPGTTAGCRYQQDAYSMFSHLCKLCSQVT